MMKNYTTVGEYIASFPPVVRRKLDEMRALVKKAAPDAGEAIRYGMPTLRLNGNLVHFAAFKDHIGFYPAASGVRAFTKELAKYDTSKGAIRFPKDKKLPSALIQKIVRFRVRENLKK